MERTITNCPRCGYGLVPVHTIENRQRRVLYYSCPDWRCAHQEGAAGKDRARVSDVDEAPSLVRDERARA